MNERILIVEDQFIEANNLQMILERAGYFVCPIALSVEEALIIIIEYKPDLVLLDIYLQGPLTGIDLAKILKEKDIAFVYLSANSNKNILDAAKATEPYGFLVKPFREKDVLVTLDIAHYLHNNNLKSRLRIKSLAQGAIASGPAYNLKGGNEKYTTGKVLFQNIVGNSRSLLKILEHLEIVAPLDTSVLIMGESGTGKERIADCIHQLSPRKSKPFIKVNCAALPAALIESELFGHERGAFTGAFEKRTGKFEQAHNGTIFLDEIGEMPLDLQVKMLRVLQEREIERIGGKQTIKVNVRIIAATNRELEKEVAEGRFRIDLYYRLNVFPLTLPPLRERKEDIPELANHFIRIYSQKIAKNITGISSHLLNGMAAYNWPGNIRELEHFIERAILLTQGSIINDVPLPKSFVKDLPAGNNVVGVKTLTDNERDNILAALRETNGKVFGLGGAAELLGVPVTTLNAKIKKLGIEKGSWWK